MLLYVEVIPRTLPTYLNLSKDQPSKNLFFRRNPYKIETMITSLKEMHFGHMTLFTI